MIKQIRTGKGKNIRYLSIIFLAFFLIITSSFSNKKAVLPYQNESLSIEERVNDLVSRMTLDEKISQMMYQATAISRLGIPSYNWWNEGLHGVGRAGVATVFPQAIGMGASFNDSLLFIEASVISDEFRAKYNEYQRHQDNGQYKGLTVWSPNINIFRDPRWGRGQETYGEDPWLTSRMGVAFIKGLQGNDPVYLKTVATEKHYVVHSGPESSRHIFNANVSDRDFYETYTPAFEAGIKEGKAYSIMGAYNRFRGKSCSGSDTLLTDILRKQWGFPGYVVSDCGAVTDIYASHKIVSTPAEAAAIAVKAGCDLECGDTYIHLKEAVEKGFITEKEIDVSVKRLFTARFKLGMFDSQGKVPYNKIPLNINDSKEHRDLSLTTALQSLVLLKNDNILPLKKNLKAIAVFGPNANEHDVLYGNYNGTPSKSVSILEGIKSVVSPGTTIYYNQASYLASNNPYWDLVSNCFEDGLNAEYFNNDSLYGKSAGNRKFESIDFKCDTIPYHGLGADHYSIRWTGTLIAPATGNFEFTMTGDDGYRVIIDRKKILEDWTSHNTTSRNGTFAMVSGQKYKITVEYFNGLYSGSASLRWKIPGLDAQEKALELAKKSDISIFVGGLSPSLEGEEMDVQIEGFKGGDRVTMNLPASQEEFLKKLIATGKPVVLVLLNGSALAINWEKENIPGILEAWYPGEEGGTAVAKTLFGDYNPGGRLPVTFYKSIQDIPAFDNYDMEGRTYRYFRGTPLYPFGFGLSYTQFEYSNIKLSAASISKDDALLISADIKNAGKYEGDEVIQVYVKDVEASTPRPIKELKAFSRISLKPGQTKTITFRIKAEQLQIINAQGKKVIEPGVFELSIGSSSTDIRLKQQFSYK